jgi:hypothetical protein
MRGTYLRVAKWILTIGLGILLLIDGIVAFRLIHDGWPKHVVGTVVGDVAQVYAVPISMNASGWILFIFYVFAHLALCYGIWKLWRLSSIRNSSM